MGNMKDFLKCFFPDRLRKYSYLGYTYNPYNEGTDEWKAVEAVVQFIDDEVVRWWTPRFFLRLLQLWGNDNSIARVKIRWMSSLLYKLKKGITITDIKTKWGDADIRVYGFFTDKIDKRIELLEKEIDFIFACYEAATHKPENKK